MSGAPHDPARTRVARAFKALGDPVRLAIVEALRASERNVTELAEATGATQPSVSKHLQVLHAADIVRRRRSGLYTCYRLADAGVAGICDAMQQRIGPAVLDPPT